MKRILILLTALCLLLTSCGLPLPGRSASAQEENAAPEASAPAAPAADAEFDADAFAALFDALAEADGEAADSALEPEEPQEPAPAFNPDGSAFPFDGYDPTPNLIFYSPSLAPDNRLMYYDCTVTYTGSYGSYAYVLGRGELGTVCIYRSPTVANALPPVSEDRVRIYYIYAGWSEDAGTPLGAFLGYTTVMNEGQAILSAEEAAGYVAFEGQYDIPVPGSWEAAGLPRPTPDPEAAQKTPSALDTTVGGLLGGSSDGTGGQMPGVGSGASASIDLFTSDQQAELRFNAVEYIPKGVIADSSVDISRVICVLMDYTNSRQNTPKTVSADFQFSVYQNGVELDSNFTYWNDSYAPLDNYFSKSVMSGGTVTVARFYQLTDASPITIEAHEVGNSDNSQSMTVTLALN